MHNYYSLFSYWHPKLVSALEVTIFIKKFEWKIDKKGFFIANINSKESFLFQWETNKSKVKYIALSFWTVKNYKNQKNSENFKKQQWKNECMCQCKHVQNLA